MDANGTTHELTAAVETSNRVSKKPVGPYSFRSCKFRGQVISSRTSPQGDLTFVIKIFGDDHHNATALQYTGADMVEFTAKRAPRIEDYKSRASTFADPTTPLPDDTEGRWRRLFAEVRGG